jgi:glycosyltransferase involved in cell wall biosynthesis
MSPSGAEAISVCNSHVRISAEQMMTSRVPLVSCIMPTKDRPRLAAQAVRCLQRQEYRHLELIVVDDGDRPVAEALPHDDRIRVIRLDRPATVGHKRNLACEAGRGEFVAHWDDDDWQSPRRLGVQLDALRRLGADAIGLANVLHYSPAGGSVWLRAYRHPTRPGVAGGTLLYRRALWSSQPFPDLDIGEDEAFLNGMPPGRLLAMDDTSLYVAVIHAGNTGRQNLRDPRWSRRTPDDIAEMLVRDWAFYSSLRDGDAVATRPPAPHSGAVNLSGLFMVADGYGSMAEYVALGMDRAGARINVLPCRIIEAGLSERLLELVRRSTLDRGAPLVHHSPVDTGLHLYERSREYVISSMWESDGLPTAWLPAMQRARSLVAPTRWCADVFRAHGLGPPVHVVPDGVDPAVYHYQPPIEREGVTTLMICSNVGRKHFAEGIAAWKRAFAADPTAQLLLKAHHQHGVLHTDDPRISYIDVNESTRGIAHWYRRADVLMALGNEGFGLPLVEAMACGLPVVALNSEGQSDICAEVPDLVLAVPARDWEPHVAGPYGRCGKRAVPCVDTAAERLRWVAEHRAEAQAMGQAASAWAVKHRNVWDKGPALLEIVEQALDPPRSLRTRPAALTARPR